MKYLDKRAEVILRDLKKYMVLDSQDIEEFLYTEGYYVTPSLVDEKNLKKFNTKTMLWVGVDKHYHFRANVKLDKKFNGKKLWLEVKTQKSGHGACQNAAFLLFINDEIIQGLDTKHEEALIFENTNLEEVKIDLQAHTGYFDTNLQLLARFYTIDEKIQKLYYHILMPIQAFEWLKEDSQERIQLLYHINETINLLDMREIYSESFYNSLDKAIDYIEKNIYEDMAGNSDVIASCIGHTHIDVAWRWTVNQSREKVSRSFSTVVKLMDEYDNYKFMSSQPILYKFLKERYINLYEKVKKKIKEKKWEAEGSMYLEADTNLTSGESLIRQIYYGKKFFLDEFEIKDNKILWLPDVFGYSGNLPQIMKKCNIDYFMTTKLNWNQYNKMPNDTFIWQGIDGSEILSHLITTTELKQSKDSYFTTYNGMLHPDAIMGAWNRYQNKNINNDILISYGYGDGGGGPTREMLEISRRMEKGIKGIPKVEQKFAIDYFEKLNERVKDNKRLEKYVGELYFEYHRGTLTSMARNKRDNRKSEILLMDTEFISTISNLKYPYKKLDEIWELVLLNQFHDILPGSSIKDVYDVTEKEYEKILTDLNKLKLEHIDSLKINDKGITVLNTLSHKRSDYVNLKDIIGNKSGYLGDNIVQNGIAYVKNINPKGYNRYDFVEKNIEFNDLLLIDNKIDLPLYTIKFDEMYNIVSLFDKENNREVANGKLNELIVYEDKPMWHDNWDIDEYYSEKSYKIDKIVSFKVLENGPLYLLIEIKKQISNSEIVQKMYIYKNEIKIDFVTEIDWKNSQHLLKAHFPVNIHTNFATFDIQFGNVVRPNHKNTSWDRARFECGAHKYIDLSEPNYGVSILNDCKYGHSVDFNNMAITLIKSGIEPNEYTDIEKHYITYSLYVHKNDLAHSNVVQKSYELNYPLLAIKGTLINDNFSFLNVDKDNIIVETIKNSYDKNGIILRIYESINSYTNSEIKLNKKYKKAYICDALENNLEEIKIVNNKIKLQFSGFEFKTIRLEE